MPQQTTATLHAIVSDLLANLAFMFADDEASHCCSEGPWLETSISYQGPAAGTLCLQCTRDFSVLLASNLLAAEPEDECAESKANDAVMEFMNILCGQCITTWHGADEVFQLTIPQVTELPGPPRLEETGGPLTATLSISGHPVRVSYLPHARCSQAELHAL